MYDVHCIHIHIWRTMYVVHYTSYNIYIYIYIYIYIIVHNEPTIILQNNSILTFILSFGMLVAPIISRASLQVILTSF